MGSYRSKEDDVSKISTSIYVTNFPETFSAKDLFHSCKVYGHVVDSFIPLKRSKDGKRFGFVRFINVFSVERLVSNLCTIWVDRFKLHPNVAHFNRPHMKDHPSFARKGPEVSRGSFNSTNNKAAGDKGYAKTSVNVVKDNRFDDIKISYMGEFWVLLEFDSIKTKDAFYSNVGVGSWFSALRQASNEFITEGRIAWVEVEGIPFKFWPKNTFNKIATKWGRLLDVDDQDESNFHSKRLCLHTQLCSNIFESFKAVFRGKVYWVRAKEVPGWILEFLEESEEDVFSDEGISNKMNDGGEVPDIDEVPETDFEEIDGLKEAETNEDQAKSVNGDNPNDKSNDVQVEHDGNSIDQASKIANLDSIGRGRFKKSVAPCNGGSILSLMEEVVRVAKIAQKIKIRWCVEGDENSKFFHGMLNKKRSQSNIQGVLIDGKWTDEPVKVKGEFFHHFSNRFGKPSDDRVEIDMNFPNTLSVYQKADLKSMNLVGIVPALAPSQSALFPYSHITPFSIIPRTSTLSNGVFLVVGRSLEYCHEDP
nr:nucleotide-binding alpha-beta plait domain-containing protein [Tanacetum cinerariifolium]